MMKNFNFIKALAGVFLLGVSAARAANSIPPITDGPSIQRALDASPGMVVQIPPGDYEISEPIRISGKNSGLCGPARIIQNNPNAVIVDVEGSENIRLTDLTLTRPEQAADTKLDGLHVSKSRNVVCVNLQVLDNRSDDASVFVEDCEGFILRDSLIRNYSRISIDDRTGSINYGYAFNCINGTGLIVKTTKQIMITNNRIIETRMLPTPELKAKYSLGTFVKKNPQKGRVVNQQSWDAGYVNNWHQGSAMQVTSPEVSDYVQIIGNYVENAAQGIDIHADHVIMADNIVNNAFMGMKAMHGARNVIIADNQFSKNDLWSIGLMPGTSSHAAMAVTSKGKPAAANIDGHSIVANNIISDFGYGNSHWMWGSDGTPLKFDASLLPTNPPLSDVIVEGNIVYDTGKDQILVDGKPRVEPPRYKHAVGIAGGKYTPVNLRFSNNLLDPGAEGISGMPLVP